MWSPSLDCFWFTEVVVVSVAGCTVQRRLVVWGFDTLVMRHPEPLCHRYAAHLLPPVSTAGCIFNLLNQL